MALTDSLVAFYRLDGDGVDATGRGNDVTNSGASWVAGLIGSAADCEATESDFLWCADNADLSMGDIDATIVAWVKPESNPAVAVAVAKWRTGGGAGNYLHNEYWLGCLSGVPQSFVSGDGSAQTGKAWTGGALSTGVWAMLAWQHDAAGNTVGISVNGAAFQTAGHTTGIFNGTSRFNIGESGLNAFQYWDGLIDMVGVWKRALSGAEITELYNAGAGLDPTASGQPAALRHGALGRRLFGPRIGAGGW